MGNVRKTFAGALFAFLLVGCSGSAASELSSGAADHPAPDPAAADRIDLGTLEGRIVFSNGTEDVWSMRADGTDVVRLTRSRALQFDPTWSPDGSRIAYRHQTGDDSSTEIYVMDADGSHPTRLTRNHVADWGPDWSPDGAEIAWNSQTGSGSSGLLGYVMAPDGSGRARLSRHPVEYPAWSPDGSRIAFMAQEPDAYGSNPDYNIFVMNADGSDLRRLTTAPGEDGWPAWSPDGSRIVFASARDDCSVRDLEDCRTTGDIGPWMDPWIVDADGSDQHRLTWAFGQFFAWSPDGSAILATGYGGLYVIRPDGSGKTPFPVEGVPDPLLPDWTA